ncbi:MAG: PHP domain-containing protein [Dehalococcoidia bacterium]|nr:PHP domain-containing protein [Dehalococcoidia bacterium]
MTDEPIYDFHTHSFLSDGVFSPIELIRRVHVLGYQSIAITDHVGSGGIEQLLASLAADCAEAERHWGIRCLPGVELTHLPPEAIANAAARARRAGAAIVVVHGESITEPVVVGTNRAAVVCPDVDILGHPGLITAEDVQLAREHGVYLEVSAKPGHGLTNGHVARLARHIGAPLIVNSDGHRPGDYLTSSMARNVALGAGLPETELTDLLQDEPQRLLERVEQRRVALPSTAQPA